jgi:hypothetical protein
MLKLSSLWFLGGWVWVTALALWGPPALAQTCTVDCRSGQIQFTPGDRITVLVVNRSNVAVGVEQPPLVGPRTLIPGGTAELGFGWGTQPNISILFWALADRPIRVNLSRPAATTLQVEIYSAPSEPSDRSLFIENDGRVVIQ